MYKNIDIEIVRNNINRKKLSMILGISESTLRRYIKKQTDIPSSKLIQMSKLFNCTTDYLLSDTTKGA